MKHIFSVVFSIFLLFTLSACGGSGGGGSSSGSGFSPPSLAGTWKEKVSGDVMVVKASGDARVTARSAGSNDKVEKLVHTYALAGGAPSSLAPIEAYWEKDGKAGDNTFKDSFGEAPVYSGHYYQQYNTSATSTEFEGVAQMSADGNKLGLGWVNHNAVSVIWFWERQ